jgi:hypothetical protein
VVRGIANWRACTTRVAAWTYSSRHFCAD